MEALIFGILVLIFSVIIHEVAHGYAAHALGDPTAKLAGRLTLNPAPHIDPIGSVVLPGLLVATGSSILFGWAKPVPYNPYNLKNQRWGEAIVGIAGVATNLFIAVLFAFIARAAYGSGMGEFGDFASIVTLTNLSLALFNLLPIPPLDGFTVLRGVLPYRFSMVLREFEERMQAGSIFTLFALLFLFSYFFAGPFSRLIFWLFGILIGG